MLTRRASLAQLVRLFLKLGTQAFGGPAAHIAMMRQEVVERRAWLADAEFLDLLGAAHLIPGPSSTELAIHIGFRIARWPGLVLAGVCFILPAAVLVGLMAWFYRCFQALPQLEGVLYAIKPVVVVIVVQALWSLARSALKTAFTTMVAVAAFILAAIGLHELLVLLICGIAVMLMRSQSRSTLSLLLAPATAGSVAVIASPVSLWGVFLVFAKIGAIVFGSGYVLLAFLQADLVQRLHWLTAKQLLDAVAIGQVTPGPVFTTATFIGYLLAGFPGACVATLAIFLPGFILVALSGPLLPRIRRSPSAAAFLDGVTAASIALIAWVLCLLARAALIDPLAISIALACAFLLFRFRFNTAWLILGAGLGGACLAMLR